MSDVNESCDRPPPRLGPWDGVSDLLGEVRRLAETPRPPEGFSLDWQVGAFFLGDMPAIGAAAIRFTND